MAKKSSKLKAAGPAGTPPEPDHVNDMAAIARVAVTTADRCAALQWCLANAWAGQDIDTIERIDTTDWHGWAMWLRV